METCGTRTSGGHGGTRTHEWRNQNPLPYRLATHLCQTSLFIQRGLPRNVCEDYLGIRGGEPLAERAALEADT